MARKKMDNSSEPETTSQRYPTPKARTPESRLRQLQARAVDLAEQRLMDGTASGAEILYFLKTTSPKEVRELEQLELQNELLRAKIDATRSEQESNRIYSEALKAFAGYRQSFEQEDVIDGDFIERR